MRIIRENSVFVFYKIFIYQHVFCSIINKNPELDTGVPFKGQKRKIANHWLFLLPQSKIAIVPPGTPYYCCLIYFQVEVFSLAFLLTDNSSFDSPLGSLSPYY